MLNGFDFETISEEFLEIFIAILIGILIGAEREYRGKSAGLRTFILVAFGSCIFTILSIRIGIQNPDRLAANIITGIGFLGAGVIFKDENKIGGITTATTIWATASLGMAAGSGHIYLALLGTAVVLITLAVLIYLQAYIDRLHKTRDYKIVTASEENNHYVTALFVQHNLKFTLVRQEVRDGHFSSTWSTSGRLENHEFLLNQLVHDPRIIAYQF